MKEVMKALELAGVKFEIFQIFVNVFQCGRGVFFEFSNFFCLTGGFQCLHYLFHETLHLSSEVLEAFGCDWSGCLETATIDNVNYLACATFFQIISGFFSRSICSFQLDDIGALGRKRTGNFDEAGLSGKISDVVCVGGHLISSNNALVDLHFVVFVFIKSNKLTPVYSCSEEILLAVLAPSF